jgi:hypothetical protein
VQSVVAAGCRALVMGAAFVLHLRRGGPVATNMGLVALSLAVVLGKVLVSHFQAPSLGQRQGWRGSSVVAPCIGQGPSRMPGIVGW